MATLLYQGHGSLRLKTDSGKVIYIDPFAGKGYELFADLILVTHQHSDHNKIKLPKKNPDCVIWQNTDALKDGEYQKLDLDFAKIEAVPAYNKTHSREKCVGYIVSVDSVSVYFAGDTGMTDEMANMAERHLDYAILPMDKMFTMDIDEAMRCAELIGAKHTIPVHMAPGKLFDRKRAERFKAEGRLIVEAGESITL